MKTREEKKWASSIDDGPCQRLPRRDVHFNDVRFELLIENDVETEKFMDTELPSHVGLGEHVDEGVGAKRMFENDSGIVGLTATHQMIVFTIRSLIFSMMSGTLASRFFIYVHSAFKLLGNLTVEIVDQACLRAHHL